MFAVQADLGANFASEIHPGYPGVVVAEGPARSMTSGFPLVLKSKKTDQSLRPKPVNNAREAKLTTAFWRDSFVKRRCLIPVMAWAEAEGEKGSMTRTWYSLHGEELFAVGGVWRSTAEWADAYSMVMVNGCEQMSDVHDRMPTILHRDQWEQWTDGTPEEAISLARVCELPLGVDRTPEPWAKARLSGAA